MCCPPSASLLLCCTLGRQRQLLRLIAIGQVVAGTMVISFSIAGMYCTVLETVSLSWLHLNVILSGIFSLTSGLSAWDLRLPPTAQQLHRAALRVHFILALSCHISIWIVFVRALVYTRSIGLQTLVEYFSTHAATHLFTVSEWYAIKRIYEWVTGSCLVAAILSLLSLCLSLLVWYALAHAPQRKASSHPPRPSLTAQQSLLREVASPSSSLEGREVQIPCSAPPSRPRASVGAGRPPLTRERSSGSMVEHRCAKHAALADRSSSKTEVVRPAHNVEQGHARRASEGEGDSFLGSGQRRDMVPSFPCSIL